MKIKDKILSLLTPNKTETEEEKVNNATGVRAQNLMENDTVVSVNKIVNTDKDDDDVDPQIGSGEILKASLETEPAGEQTSLLEETTEE